MMISSLIKPFFANIKSKVLYGMTEKECVDGVNEICEFFGIPVPVLIQNVTDNPRGSTCIYPNNPDTMEDDILCFDLKQLKSMGVSDKVTFMAVMTHECAHRVFQNHWFPGPDMGQWESEMVADYFMGVKIGLEGWDAAPIIRALEMVPGSGTHPVGKVRAEYVKLGRFEAHKRMIQRRTGTISDYLTSFLQYREAHSKELRKAELTIY